MNYQDALARLSLICAPDSDPTLSTNELGALLDEHAAIEIDEVTVYTPTGVYRAATEAWRIKAGRASDRFDFVTDGQNFRRSQIHAMCLAQADRYARKVQVSPSVSPPVS